MIGRHHVARCGSTNDEARRVALAGAALPLLLTTDEQTGGRGRGGRSWVHEAGNFAGSFALAADRCPAPRRAAACAFAASLSVAEAFAAHAPPGDATALAVKWPNDVLLGGAKLAGCLAEEADGLLVVGIGANLAARPRVEDRAVAAWSFLNAGTLADELVERFPALLASAATDEGWRALRERWLGRAAGFGETVTVRDGACARTGVFRGVDEVGRLLLAAEGQTLAVTAGDVRTGLET